MRNNVIRFLWRRRTTVFTFGPFIMLLAGRPELHTFFLGLPFVIVGQLIRLWAAGHLTKMGKVVTSGPFGYVRNPLYCGSLLIFSGICVMMNSWALVPVFLFAFAAFHIGATLWEEKLLKETFGKDFEEYCMQVPRLLPRLKKYGSPGKFSFKLACINREPISALATAVMVILFGLRAVLRG